MSLLLRLVLYVHSHYQCNILLISVELPDNLLLLEHFNGKLFSKSNVMELKILKKKKIQCSALFSVAPFTFIKSSNSYFNLFQMAAVCL